jgi:Zn ribbon nucleic-acid-binding protein
MSETLPPALPTADCPTCRTKHSVALEENQQIIIQCGACGKMLRIERGPGAQLVVMEQYDPLTGTPPPPAT